MKTDYPKKQFSNLKGEGIEKDHKRDAEMISERKEKAKGPKFRPN